jgi:hypothetical protein
MGSIYGSIKCKGQLGSKLNEKGRLSTQCIMLLFPSNITTHPLPFDSIPIHTYLGNSIIHPNLPPTIHPSSSNIPSTSEPDPHWSRGIGLELSPLKTRSARKKALSGLKASENSATITTQGALRDFKALARGNT